VRGHHERCDGKGYPDSLNDGQIGDMAAIVSAADAYDAMTSDRPYRKALDKEAAVAELLKNKGTQFRPGIVDALLGVLREES
jgi:HD-GYP domain-containing protein (c-di-GMP phosphodiesterase class II)